MPLIAVLEDDDQFLAHLSNEIMTQGYEVVGDRDKSNFLELMPAVMPDVIITDIKAPRMDGMEFLKAIKKDPRFCKIPVIIVSGFLRDNIETAMEAHRLGVFDCFAKPYDHDELMRRIKDALQQN